MIKCCVTLTNVITVLKYNRQDEKEKSQQNYSTKNSHRNVGQEKRVS